MSYRIGVKGHRRAAARLVAKMHRTLQRAYEKRREEGLTQTELASSLDVHRSVVNRQLNGVQDMSIGRVAEYAHLLGYDVEFDFVERSSVPGSNLAPSTPPIFQARTASSGGVQHVNPSNARLIARSDKALVSGTTARVIVEA